MTAPPRKPASRVTPAEPAGIVGLGLMGSSIATCLLAAGHPLAGVCRTADEKKKARSRIAGHLKELRKEGLLRGRADEALSRLSISCDYATLSNASFVAESIIEDLPAKRGVLSNIEAVVAPGTVIGSNTSALPVTQLQQGMRYPGRVLGIHWAEPAHITRFMEIICGRATEPAFAKRAMKLAEFWGKEPSLLRRDIRGFITNRIMYAMLREAFHLVEAGLATPQDVDRSLRNDYGSWMTFAGPFRMMDIAGVPAFGAVMKDLFPELSCETTVPPLMKKVLKSGGRGLANQRGFYKYSRASARRWEKKFIEFSYDIRRLSLKYRGIINS